MVPDGRTEWTDGRTDDTKTISLRLRRGIIKLLKNGVTHLQDNDDVRFYLSACAL